MTDEAKPEETIADLNKRIRALEDKLGLNQPKLTDEEKRKEVARVRQQILRKRGRH